MLMRHILMLFALIYNSIVSGMAASDPAWLDVLKLQLVREQACELAFLVSLREDALAGRATVEARIRCVDGRSFDASRIAPEVQFIIKQCQIEVC
jgi:hypothetical protein